MQITPGSYVSPRVCHWSDGSSFSCWSRGSRMLNTGHRVRSVQGGGHHHRSTGISCCARREKKPSREIRALGAPWTVSAFFRKTRSAARSTRSFGRRLDSSRLFSGHTGHCDDPRHSDPEGALAENSSFCVSSILSVLSGVGGRVFLGDVAPQPRCVFGCPPKRVLCDSRCNTKLPELELGQKPPIFVAGSSQAGGVAAVDSGLSAIQHKGLPSAAAPAIFSML